MPKPSEIITAAAALMNDSAQTQYTNAAVLPYFNLALDELQETFELNGLPITHKTTPAVITVPAVSKAINIFVGFDTNPALPSDLIEIEQIWESQTGLNQWTPMTKKDFLPHYLEDGTTISNFLIWSWENEKINLVAANQVNDLKLDYVGSIFKTPILIGNINMNLPYTKVKTYLEYKTAALCALFVAENESRAMALDSLTTTALSRSMGIQIKGLQSIVVRRKPFRYSFKHRGVNY